MKILICSTPATGHVNPMLTIAGILMAAEHDLVMLCGSSFRDRIESTGATFRALPGNADIDGRDILGVVPELKTIPPGVDWLRVAIGNLFVARIPAQHQGLREALSDLAPDLVIADDMFFGAIPMLLGPRDDRPPIVLCGTSFLHWERADNAPHFAGLPPAANEAERAAHALVAREHDERINRPIGDTLNRILSELGVGPVSMTLFDSVVKLADTYIQLTVPSFEFPRDIPPTVQFIGALPIIPHQAPLPAWADDLNDARKVVLVTQGTVANHNFDLLVGPTLAGLADEPDVLVVATAGGRPVDAIPGPIPENARVADYLPFDWLLQHVDVMVTNGGYGSVNQALSFGVPIVAAGLTEDKADVNVRIAWSGAGIDLRSNDPSPDAIRDAVRAVLDTPQYRDHAQRLRAEHARYDARSELLRIVEAHAGGAHGRSSKAAA